MGWSTLVVVQQRGHVLGGAIDSKGDARRRYGGGPDGFGETDERVSAAQEEITAHERSGKRTKPQLKATNVYRSVEPEPMIPNRRTDLALWDLQTSSDCSLSPSLALVAPHQSPL
ncbi:hypothetical protein U1Q18_035416 [Sarracenia purpurea var. burkii]